jgi:hypothetical protein
VSAQIKKIRAQKLRTGAQSKKERTKQVFQRIKQSARTIQGNPRTKAPDPQATEKLTRKQRFPAHKVSERAQPKDLRPQKNENGA